MNGQTEQLMKWYDSNRRILPWREDPAPYHVWLSEIMLQQTRVEAGISYYERFVQALPDIRSLAEAKEDQYLKLWEGLGYYSRVRNLHKAAEIVMEEYGGKLPDTVEELQKLPGIGPYSAAAIASIAYGRRVVSVDGNLVRVFARMTEYGGDSRTVSARKAAEQYYAQLQPEDRPGDFNQALMDLGATVCLPNGEPLCGRCPWQEACAAHRDRRTSSYPVMPGKKKRRVEDRTVLILEIGDCVLIRRRPSKGLLAGLYEFPNREGELKTEEAAAYAGDVLTEAGIVNLFPDPVSEQAVIVPLGQARHVFTHVEWHMTGYRIRLPQINLFSRAEKTGEEPGSGIMKLAGGWLAATPEQLDRYCSIPSAFEAYRSRIGSQE